MKVIYYYPHGADEEIDWQSLNNLSKVTQLVNGEATL